MGVKIFTLINLKQTAFKPVFCGKSEQYTKFNILSKSHNKLSAVLCPVLGSCTQERYRATGDLRRFILEKSERGSYQCSHTSNKQESSGQRQALLNGSQ